MNPLVIAQALKGAGSFFSNRKVQIAILIIILYFIFKKKIKQLIRNYKQRKFNKNEAQDINQLAQQYRAAANRSGIEWMINFDGTNTDIINNLAFQTKGRFQEVADAYRLKFEESLTDRMRKELSTNDFQNWWNIVT